MMAANDGNSMRAIAIWDLDGTLLRRATFTPFLLHAARRRRPLRFLLSPVWIAAMVGYKAGFWSREALKQFGLRLFLGRVGAEDLESLAQSFADRVLPDGIGADARTARRRDEAEGRVPILATAAMGFYACEIARRAGFEHVVATRHAIDGRGYCRIEGGNCYGANKVPRVEALLAALGIERGDLHVRFYSDSVSDAPLLDWSDEAVLVNTGKRGAHIAERRGWRVARFR